MLGPATGRISSAARGGARVRNEQRRGYPLGEGVGVQRFVVLLLMQ
jgi:hypothetical protein